ncbi:MAG: GGDEF domain-containing protein, partial [Deltaproteobacteria bacterium]|nr:GGDEF domain-containing protein [Deltaproteobacteria bacterium]
TEALNKALREVSDLVVQMDSMLHQVEQLAVTDTLTESFNRRKFDEVAVLEQQRVLRGKLPFSVIMLDIDRFKRVNDCYGHSVGDQVLKHLCDVVRRLIRTGDMLIRWGGEEFLIILPATQLDEAGPLAERIRVAVKQEHFPSVGQITVSLGVAQLRIEDSIDSLIQRVDQALYRAKQAGRDRMVFEAPAPEPTEGA